MSEFYCEGIYKTKKRLIFGGYKQVRVAHDYKLFHFEEFGSDWGMYTMKYKCSNCGIKFQNIGVESYKLSADKLKLVRALENKPYSVFSKYLNEDEIEEILNPPTKLDTLKEQLKNQ